MIQVMSPPGDESAGDESAGDESAGDESAGHLVTHLALILLTSDAMAL